MVEFQRENLSLSPKWGISEEKAREICLNVRFLKIKHDIFAKMGDFRRENA